MASRIMHYAIAHLVTESIHIENRYKFILGNLEPDISIKIDRSYDKAHFADDNIQANTRGINWLAFVDKYKDVILEDDELLGYLCHLISDACWLKNIRDKNIRVFDEEKKKALTLQGYEEMRRYNSIFIEKFGLKNEIQQIDDLCVEEVNIDCKDKFVLELANDFKVSESSECEFEVYPNDQIMDYIQYCVSKIVHEIYALRNNKPLGNPEEFYVKS